MIHDTMKERSSLKEEILHEFLDDPHDDWTHSSLPSVFRGDREYRSEGVTSLSLYNAVNEETHFKRLEDASYNEVALKETPLKDEKKRNTFTKREAIFFAVVFLFSILYTALLTPF